MTKGTKGPSKVQQFVCCIQSVFVPLFFCCLRCDWCSIARRLWIFLQSDLIFEERGLNDILPHFYLLFRFYLSIISLDHLNRLTFHKFISCFRNTNKSAAYVPLLLTRTFHHCSPVRSTIAHPYVPPLLTRTFHHCSPVRSTIAHPYVPLLLTRTFNFCSHVRSTIAHPYFPLLLPSSREMSLSGI